MTIKSVIKWILTQLFYMAIIAGVMAIGWLIVVCGLWIMGVL